MENVVATTKGGCVPLVQGKARVGFVCFGPDKKWMFSKDKEYFGFLQEWYGITWLFKRPKGFKKKLFYNLCSIYPNAVRKNKNDIRNAIAKYCKEHGLNKRRHIDIVGE